MPRLRSSPRLPSLLLAGLLAAPSLHAAALRATRRQLDAVHARIVEAARALGRDTLEQTQLSAQLRGAEIALGQARARLEALNARYRQASARRAALALQSRQLRARLSQQRAVLAAQLRAAYLLGRDEPLRLVLDGQDPVSAERLLRYYAYFGRARARQIALIEQRERQLAALERSLAQQQAQLAALGQAAQQELATLQRSSEARRRVLVQLAAQNHNRRLYLASLNRRQSDLQRLLARIERAAGAAAGAGIAIAPGTPFARLRGRLAWPVSGHIAATFGSARPGGARWDGIVIATRMDQPVRAVAAGRVVYADWLPGLGLLVIIDHGGGYLSLYAHNDLIYRAVGDTVRPGETIAAAGDSGGQRSPELYFQMRLDGRPIDPLPWFAQRAPRPAGPRRRGRDSP